MVTAYVGIGSNMGDRLGNVSRAVDAISHLPETHVTKSSRAYESEPAYHRDQQRFVNAVVEVETGLEAEALLAGLLGIEDEMGRVREVEKGPRVIDLDLLLYDEEERVSEELTLPHPGVRERDFVVTPLLEIAPRTTLPDGTHVRRSEAHIGPVIRDLGHIPDAGAEHNMPIEATEWVSIATTEGPQTAIGGFDASVQFKRQVLEQEGVPYAFEPFEPGLDVDLLGRTQVFNLVVPAEYEQRVIELFQRIEEAPPIEEPEQAQTESAEPVAAESGSETI